MLLTVALRCTAPRSVEEQDISDVDRGKAFLGCYPLHQRGDLQSELDRKGLESVGATNRGNFANYRSNGGLTDRRSERRLLSLQHILCLQRIVIPTAPLRPPPLPHHDEQTATMGRTETEQLTVGTARPPPASPLRCPSTRPTTPSPTWPHRIRSARSGPSSERDLGT
jgi:hypothetical protein